MTLIGQKPFGEYEIVRQEMDAFYALSFETETETNPKAKKGTVRKKTMLTTWDIITGKLFCHKPLDKDLSDYERFKTTDCDMYHTGIHKNLLMVSKVSAE